jgi:hypothetical protein
LNFRNTSKDHFDVDLSADLVAMLSQRKRSLSAKLGASKKSVSPQKRRPPAPKKEWNDFQNDPNRYKLTKEEELRKKQLLVSRNNILTTTVHVGSGKYTPSAHKPPVQVAATAGSNAQPTEMDHTEVDALDLLGSDKEDAHTTPVASKKKKVVSSAMKAKLASKENKRPDTVESKKSPAAPSSSSSNSKLRRNLDHEYDASEASCEEEVVKERASRTPSPTHKHRIGSTSFTSSSGARRTPTTRSSPHNASHSAPASVEKDYDLVYVADEVRSLFSELKYYEELSGRRSILDTREVSTDTHCGTPHCSSVAPGYTSCNPAPCCPFPVVTMLLNAFVLAYLTLSNTRLLSHRSWSRC